MELGLYYNFLAFRNIQSHNASSDIQKHPKEVCFIHCLGFNQSQGNTSTFWKAVNSVWSVIPHSDTAILITCYVLLYGSYVLLILMFLRATLHSSTIGKCNWNFIHLESRPNYTLVQSKAWTDILHNNSGLSFNLRKLLCFWCSHGLDPVNESKNISTLSVKLR